jgi:hypothetical protein
MKKKTKVLSAVALGLLVVLGVSVYASGGSLQGRFGMPSPLSPCAGTVTSTLSSASPSGLHSATIVDDIFSFQLASSTSCKLVTGTLLRIGFASSDASLNSASDGMTVYLKESGVTVATGTLELSTERDAHAFLATNKVFGLSYSAKTYTVVLDSTTLMTNEPGVDDTLVVDLAFTDGTSTYQVEGTTVSY